MIAGYLSRIYRKTGIHGAPPGTMLHGVNAFVHSIVHRRARGYAHAGGVRRGAFGGIGYYDIARLRRVRPVNGLALIFFMGAGDYLMATPMIKALHQAHPDLPIWAYVSSNVDPVNSPLVFQLLKANPLIHRVARYRGRPRQIWTEYDFTDALKDIPNDFVILPVIYQTNPAVRHRGTSFLETFGLRVELPLPTPIAYKTDLSPRAAEMLCSIQGCLARDPPRGIVCTHFGARSSGYNYPHAARLGRLLLERGYHVVNFSPTGMQDANLTEIDVVKITPTDSIEILRSLKTCFPRLSMITVNSIMWPVSAALDISNLGLHTFWDDAIHQYIYPNIYVVTQHNYSTVSPTRLFLAPHTSYENRKSLDGMILFTDYKPEYVADCFDALSNLVWA